MNAATVPQGLIRPDQMSLIVNGTVKNGYCRTRPGRSYIPLAFSEPKAQFVFSNGVPQGSGFYDSDIGKAFIYIVDGYVFVHDLASNVVTMLPTQYFSRFTPHIWTQQRGKYFIVQDGETSKALVFDGLEVRLDDEIPVGKMMNDGWGRMPLVSADRRKVYFSNHEMDPTATPISFTESTAYYLNARFFEPPRSMGKIMGMAFVPYADSSTGIGPLMVFCERGVQAYNVAVPRTQWTAVDIGQTVLKGIGSGSFGAYADKGAEVVFFDQNGRIRTIRNAQQNMMTGSPMPIDFALSPIIESSDKTLLEYSKAVTFDNRVLITSHPRRRYTSDNRMVVSHQGLCVLEMDVMSDNPYTWVFWTGMDVCTMAKGNFNGRDSMMMICRDEDNINRVYEMTTDQKYDRVVTSKGVINEPVEMIVGLPRLDFTDSMLVKAMGKANMRVSNIYEDLTITGRWQVNERQPHDWFVHKTTGHSQFAFNKCELSQKRDGVLERLVLPAPPEKYKNFYTTRPLFIFKGYCQLEEVFMSVDVFDGSDSSNTKCATPDVADTETVCEVDIFSYNPTAQ